MFDSLDMKSRSRRCHNVWHVPRSNWMRRESTGAHFTLKLANSGSMSVGRARFIPPRAQSDGIPLVLLLPLLRFRPESAS